MPLRSVEAATRDDAIAAAREQFGPGARIVGVRRVRSGGVLGFFATERYVAEVAPEPLGVPGVPAPSPARPAGALTEDPDTGSLAALRSPLASAAPARARTAPPRNGAAAWAAEARVADPIDRSPGALAGAPVGVRARTLSHPATEPADAARVEELAGLLGAVPPSAAQPVPGTPRAGVARASFPRATREAAVPAAEDDDATAPPAAPATGAPSPFTAALARMVAGDRDVQHAVREALETPEPARSPEQHRTRVARPEPATTSQSAVWSPATHQEEEPVGNQVIAPPSTSLDERGARAAWADEPSFAFEAFADEAPFDDEESFADEPFTFGARGDEPAAPAEPVATLEPVRAGPPAVAEQVAVEVEVEQVAAEPLPEPATAAAVTPPVSREEEIAEVLRAALAEGHSDDALAGILRRVVAGDSPRNALAAPGTVAADTVAGEPAAVETVTAETVTAETVTAETVTAEPVLVEPVTAEAVQLEEAPAEPVAEAAVEEPVAAVSRFDLFSPLPAPTTAEVPPAAAPASPVSLWGEISPAPVPTAPVEQALAVPHVSAAPAAEAPPVQEAPVEEAPVEEAPAEVLLFGSLSSGAAPFESAPSAAAPSGSPDADEPVEATPAEATTDEATTDATEQVEVLDAATDVDEALAESSEPALDLAVAPALARTASDPAPLSRSMSMDSTTVLPPLSLLPGAPSRGRGLPPVPPRTSRPPVPPSSPRLPAAPAATGPAPSDVVLAPMATVTRLPVAPLMATPETPDISELAGLADLIEADGSGLLDGAGESLAAAVPVRPSRVRIAPPGTPAEVVSRLADLGVPAHLLGPAFVADVEADGTYAALTRVLGERLPEPPEFPTGAGDVLLVVGPGVETLRAARSLAATLRLDPDRVQWATRGDLVGLAPEASRLSTIDTALRRRQDASSSGTVTIVAVDAPLRTDAYWMAQMLAVWSPVAVWAVVEATRKPEDLEHWIDGLARVDALIVQDTDLSADPAAVLHRLAAPVAVVDGVRATPHRWASVLCERLESAPA